MSVLDSLCENQMPWQTKRIIFLRAFCAPNKGLGEKPRVKATSVGPLNIVRRVERGKGGSRGGGRSTSQSRPLPSKLC